MIISLLLILLRSDGRLSVLRLLQGRSSGWKGHPGKRQTKTKRALTLRVAEAEAEALNTDFNL